MKRIAMILAALTFGGCCSIKTTTTEGRTMCVVETYGWRLWDLFPIASGNPDSPDESGIRWFTDTVTLENNQKLLDRAMKRAGASAIVFENSYMTDEQTLFTFYRRSLYTSAELLFEEKEANEQ